MIEVNLLPGSQEAEPQRRLRPRGRRCIHRQPRARSVAPWRRRLGRRGIRGRRACCSRRSRRARSEVEGKLDRALRDSTRYEKTLSARAKLVAERDSVYRQLQIIRTIDENRFTWAHILDEISRALPAYTWLTVLEQTSKAPLPPGADTVTVADAGAAEPTLQRRRKREGMRRHRSPCTRSSPSASSGRRSTSRR